MPTLSVDPGTASPRRGESGPGGQSGEKGCQARKGIAPLSMSPSSGGHGGVGIRPGVRAMNSDSTTLPTDAAKPAGFSSSLLERRATRALTYWSQFAAPAWIPFPHSTAFPGPKTKRLQALQSLLPPFGTRDISKALMQAGVVTGNPPPKWYEEILHHFTKEVFLIPGETRTRLFLLFVRALALT